MILLQKRALKVLACTLSSEQDLECSTWEAFAMVASGVLHSLSVERREKTQRSSTFRCDIPDLRPSEDFRVVVCSFKLPRDL